MKKRCKKDRNSGGSRGFTLVELSVVMVVFAILTTMTATFTVMVNKYAKSSRSEYEFLESCWIVKDKLLDWVAQNDGVGTVYEVEEKQLTVGGQRMTFADGRLSLKADVVFDVKKVDGVEFFASELGLIRCRVYCTDGEKELSSSFVFAPRVGMVLPPQSVGGGANE